MKLWAGRFQKETDTLVNDFNSSIGFDARLYGQDIAGSIAHARMLGKRGIIEAHEADTIVSGLQAILADIEAGQVEFSLDNEDIHMNIEAELTQRVGEAGKRLHTARSRNDQVAVDTRLYVKEEIPVIIGQVLDLEEVLVKKAKANLRPLHDGLRQYVQAGYHPAGGLPGPFGRVPPGGRGLGYLHLPGGPVRDSEHAGV